MKMNDSSKAIMQNGGGDPVIFCLKVMGQGMSISILDRKKLPHGHQ